jgi:hypothetical protein
MRSLRMGAEGEMNPGNRHGFAAQLVVGVLLVAAPFGARADQSPSNLTAAEKTAARMIVTNKCTVCHSLNKALRKDPVRMEAHMRKKAELSENDLKIVVPYLRAERSSGTNQASRATGSSVGPKGKPDAKDRKHEDDDEEEGDDD